MKNSGRDSEGCDQIGLVSEYVLKILASSDIAAREAHIFSCPDCLHELELLDPLVDFFVSWPTDVLRPTRSLQERLAVIIGAETGSEPVFPTKRLWVEPEWEQVAPGISCKIFAADEERDFVSMLVRLDPGGQYPPHIHAGVEQLHLLDGELWIDDRKLYPGDYNRAEPGGGDKRVWSETGCTCVLVTSTRDKLLATGSSSSDHPIVQFEVVRKDKAWLAKHPAGFAVKFPTKEAAITYAREVAMHTESSQLVVYGATGSIESREKFDEAT